MNMEELKNVMDVIKNGTVEYELVASLVADIVDFNPNWGDYWCFESVRLPIANKMVFYECSTYTDHWEVINDIAIEDDGTISLQWKFEATYRDRKDSDGKIHNDEIEMLKFIERNHTKVVNMPEN